MVRKVIANFYMTLDGRGDFPTYPGSDAKQDEPDIAFEEMWVRKYSTADTVVFGRRSYEGHYRVHSEKGRKPDDPDFLYDYSRWLDRCNKIVLSNRMKRTEWPNSRIMKGKLEDIIEQLRNEEGKDIIVEGGPSVVRECIQKDLADEYFMLVFPVVYGKKKSYWGSFAGQTNLRLISVKSMEYGELLLHYASQRKVR